MNEQKSHINIVVAMGHGRVIGSGNGLLWRIPNDMKRFKELTFGHPVIMGRKTFDSIVSILGKPLPGRTNIVITRDPAWNSKGVIAAHSLGESINKAKKIDPEIFIIGGGQIYKQALPLANRLYLTLIDDTKEGDTIFPAYETMFTKKIFEKQEESNGLHYVWLELER